MIPSPRRSDIRHSRFLLRTAALVVALGTGTTALGVVSANAARPSAKNVCAPVSGAQVSAVVGFHVPNGVGNTDTEAPTKANDGIGGKSISCIYGSFTKSLKDIVGLGFETLSRSVTNAEFEALFKKEVETAGKGFIYESYPPLGSDAAYFKYTAGQYSAAGIFVFNGNHAAFAFVYSTSITKSKIANLTKLAQNLA